MSHPSPGLLQGLPAPLGHPLVGLLLVVVVAVVARALVACRLPPDESVAAAAMLEHQVVPAVVAAVAVAAVVVVAVAVVAAVVVGVPVCVRQAGRGRPLGLLLGAALRKRPLPPLPPLPVLPAAVPVTQAPQVAEPRRERDQERAEELLVRNQALVQAEQPLQELPDLVSGCWRSGWGMGWRVSGGLWVLCTGAP